VANCSGNLHPIRGVPPGGDASTFPDAGTIPCPDQLIGFATMSDRGGEPDGGGSDGAPMWQLDGGVTGGGASTPVVIDATASDALAQFTLYATDKTPGPLTIVVNGMISIPPTPDGGDAGGEMIRVSSNKTVIGADTGSGFWGGGLGVTRVSNVIIRNLVIGKPNTDKVVDAIHIEQSHQIWIDHCDLSSFGSAAGSSYDGLVDISDQSDFVTVSWTVYHDHVDTGLIGRSDSSAAAAEDAGKEHVTYDHDWFRNVTTGPRIRFGTVHVLNSFFEGVTAYGIASTDGANVRIEASSFENVTLPGQADADFGPITTVLDSPATAGYVDLVNNLPTASAMKNVITTQAVPWMPPYIYTPDSASSVPTLLNYCAGPRQHLVPSL
jgi:pectate lyase